MNPRLSPFVMAGLAAVIATAFALFVRLPLPFDGFNIAAAAVLAALLTFAFTLFLPSAWVWSDAERLTHAFKSRHNMSDTRAALALDAVATAHARATSLRRSAARFVPELQTQTYEMADHLDMAAREVFYAPEALAQYRAIFVRSELVEDAARAHAKLRDRAGSETIAPQVKASRDMVTSALTALAEAFDAAETRIAGRILTEVDAASSTAETLLAPPRARASQRKES